MNQSVTLLPDTAANTVVTGDAVRADTWYGITAGTHTVAIYAANLTGRIYVEAALVDTLPADFDWFTVRLTDDTVYREYSAETIVEGITFTGNFTWIRARLDRDYIYSPAEAPPTTTLYGTARVLLNI